MSGTLRDEIQLSNAHLYLPTRLRKELGMYIVRQFELETLAGVVYTFGHLPLFYTQMRNPFSPTTLTQTFTAIYAKAGLQGATLKTGKKTWLYTLCARGANVKVVQRLAGRQRLPCKVLADGRLLRTVAEMI